MIAEITQGMLVRLNKFIAHAGVCSRRKADELIRSGKVHVNGKSVSNLGMRIDPRKDVVFVNEKQVVMLDEPVYIVLNKPRDCITTASDERGRATVMDYVHVRERVFPVGRLDRHTTGVLLLTNDGEFANRLMHPKSEIKKTYKVTLDKPLNPGDAEKLAGGIRLSEATTAPAEIHILPGGKKKIVGIAIREGRNRQVHRMFEALGYEVEKLDRVSYAGISSEGLARGQSRYLTKRELRALKELAGME
ncbi:MAG: pseudouridine synthase [Bacteroidota bacterium]|jgi:23S rRNA pseudouridine2605 synthase